MINENNFNALTERARKHKYSSMNYLDFEDCKHACILHDCSELILLQDKSKIPAMLYFATDNLQLVIDAIAQIPGELKIHFVPRELAPQLERLGFVEWAEFADFWNRNLSATAVSPEDTGTIEYLQQSECEEAVKIMQKCRLQSRGFEGGTAEWYADWLNENKIIIQRKNSKIVGLCCISIYDEGTTLWIKELAVDPAHQGMGFGKKLVEQAIIYGIQNGAVKGFLSTDLLNKNAIGLYEKYNFHSKYEDSELQMIRKGS